MIKCPKCSSKILPENQALNCHAHNDNNMWRPLEGVVGSELYEVLRTRVIEGTAASPEKSTERIV